MDSSSARNHLESAGAVLTELADRLVSADHISDFPSLLESVNRHLLAASEWVSSEPTEEARLLLTALNVKVQRLQALLDSAALFHCGSLYASPSSTGSYTADGSVATADPGRRFDFEV
ncbi:MAG: hypothetical protein JO217_14740 [Acidobacteriaceae bacterium]|nr:hypothetical protein [Acidobacteriaceae bacterium]MBV9443937.1 hypothetical protein [Acidobacteriaceae bacterium]